MANLLVSDDILNDGKERKSGKPSGVRHASEHNVAYADMAEGSALTGFGDSGSYSRFFSLDAWVKNLPESVQKTFPFLIVPKASKREKNDGLDGFEEKRAGTTDGNSGRSGQRTAGDGVTPIKSVYAKNTHATVKPITLMSYLITLGSRPGDVVLDPFLGSGTTACAAKALGRGYVGIEREEEYIKIAEARIKAVCPTSSHGN
jgi:site-specific DNA-methyltransferase (adenine-specific)